jgi:nitrogen fixation NifU-like protein
VSKYPARVKCALLGWMAFKDALAQALAKTAEQPLASVSATTQEMKQ